MTWGTVTWGTVAAAYPGERAAGAKPHDLTAGLTKHSAKLRSASLKRRSSCEENDWCPKTLEARNASPTPICTGPIRFVGQGFRFTAHHPNPTEQTRGQRRRCLACDGTGFPPSDSPCSPAAECIRHRARTAVAGDGCQRRATEDHALCPRMPRPRCLLLSAPRG